jgi:hypothetical protein
MRTANAALAQSRSLLHSRATTVALSASVRIVIDVVITTEISR